MQESEWEQGLIHIPKTEWTNLKQKILDAYNSLIESDFLSALSIYNLIQRDSENKRSYNFRKEAVIRITQSNLIWDSIQRIEDSLFHGTKASRKIFKPKKKDFLPATNKTTKINLGVALIGLDNKNKTIRWAVPENPDAIAQAKEHSVAKILFDTLDHIKWSKKTGGIIVGNSISNRASFTDALNYPTHSYGPLGEKIVSKISAIPSVTASY